jgi:hypothetical protein
MSGVSMYALLNRFKTQKFSWYINQMKKNINVKLIVLGRGNFQQGSKKQGTARCFWNHNQSHNSARLNSEGQGNKSVNLICYSFKNTDFSDFCYTLVVLYFVKPLIFFSGISRSYSSASQIQGNVSSNRSKDKVDWLKV